MTMRKLLLGTSALIGAIALVASADADNFKTLVIDFGTETPTEFAKLFDNLEKNDE